MLERKSIGISLNNKVLEKIDIERELIPRSRYIERLVTKHFQKKDG